MYNEHFGLSQAPFRITPDTRLFYTGGGRGDVLDALVYAITTGEGIVKVVGEVGTGKTMLCRMLEERLPENVQIAYLANPSLTPEDILHAVALELGLEVAPEAPRLQVMHALQRELLERHAQNRRVVALVEEAQSMPVGTLEEIRLLSNLETKNEKLLQIILFGQPELDDNLARPEIRQLRERITHSFKLKPLAVGEIKDYVAFRLRASGYRGRDAFTGDAYRVMSRASEGLTRRVNIIADKAMLAAFAEDTHDVSARHVKVAIRDSEFDAPNRRPRRRPGLLAAAAAAGAAVLAGGAGWYLGARTADPPAMAGVAPPAVDAAVARVASPASDAMVLAPADSAAGEARAADQPAAAAVTLAAAAAVDSPAVDSPAVNSPAMGVPATDASSTVPSPALQQPSAVSDSAPAPAVASTPPSAVASVAVDVPGSAADLPPQRLAAAPRQEDPLEAPRGLTVKAPSSFIPESVDGEGSAPGETVMKRGSATPAVEAASLVAAESESGSGPGGNTIAASPAPSAEQVSAAPAAESTVPRSVLEQRLASTRRWLERVNPAHYSIQLLATDARQRRNLEEFLRRRRLVGELDQVFVYETRINERDWFGVLYGEFASFSEARGALGELPDELRRHQPFIRNIRDIAALG